MDTTDSEYKSVIFKVVINFQARKIRYTYPALWLLAFTALSYEGRLESKERFAIKKYLLIIGKKKNTQVLSHTFTYFST